MINDRRASAVVEDSRDSLLIQPSEFEQRRTRLLTLLDNSPILLVTEEKRDLRLAYLTGYRNVSERVALLIVPSQDSIHVTVFADSITALMQWNGKQWKAVSTPVLGVQYRPIAELASTFGRLLPSSPKLSLVAEGIHLSDLGNDVAKILATHPNIILRSGLTSRINQLRAIKSPAEQALIRRAVIITTAAHRSLRTALRPGILEQEVKTVIDSVYRHHGADSIPAFLSIVASGPNSTELHYRGGNRMLKEGEHVKIDIGAAVGGYAADVTRTYPVTGVFSAEQRAIYEVVREAQAAAEAVARPGASWRDLVQASNRVLTEGLTRLGLMDTTIACSCKQLSLFFNHGLGHGLGLQVHDPKQDTLVVGTAFVIEPGIYVREKILNDLARDPRNKQFIERIRPAVERYRGIGVRIEDAYLMTSEGLEWVSQLPRDRTDIETPMPHKQHK